MTDETFDTWLVTDGNRGPPVWTSRDKMASKAIRDTMDPMLLAWGVIGYGKFGFIRSCDAFRFITSELAVPAGSGYNSVIRLAVRTDNMQCCIWPMTEGRRIRAFHGPTITSPEGETVVQEMVDVFIDRYTS